MAPDTRFSAIQSDPRFQLPRKKSIKGEVDPRFKNALENDKEFAKRTHIDKYGRRVKDKNVKKELSRYYNFDEGEAAKKDESSSESSDESSDESAEKPKAVKNMRELMRGGGISSSDESESESDSDSESEVELEEDEYEKVRVSAGSVPQGDESRRLAVVNLDWDNVRSVDLMATLSSFVPKGRRIVSIKIYPSEFGKKQMALEEVSGPAQSLFPKAKESANESAKPKKEADEDDGDYSSSKLRKYQLQRLQYYYAIVDCDSVETAAEIYSAVDGTEYESTANFFDLRFVPDEVEFLDKPRDECSKLPAGYEPTSFTTDALQHSKVKLSWDETPKERLRATQKAFNRHEMEDEDIKAYLASDSESEEDEQSIAQRYRALLGDAPTKKAVDEEDDVEITFNPVLEGKEAKLEISGGGGDEDRPEDNLSTIEQYRLKEKQRRLRRMENFKARKAAEQAEKDNEKSNDAELELLAMDDEYNEPEPKKPAKKLTKRAAKKKAQEEAEQDFDTADPRFQALYEDPDFAIDSTLPQFKKTKGMERIIDERRKRQETGSIDSENTRFGKFKRKQPTQGESIEHLASKLRRKNAAR